MQTVKFNNDDPKSKEFAQALNFRVNEFFKQNGICKKGNAQIHIKTLITFAGYILPFLGIILYQPGPLIALPLTAVMGLSMAGAWLNVIHDAIHGAYSRNKTVNRIISYSGNFFGVSSNNWKIQHNIKHHTHTNIEDHDEDIAPKALIRFTPHSRLLKIHKFQFIYAWILYGLGTFFWVIAKDFVKFNKYTKEGLVQKFSMGVRKELVILILTKILYFSLLLGIPLLFTEYSVPEILSGFVVLHICAGLGLAVIFQPAHLLEEVAYPLPDQNGQMEYSWIVHQLYTSVNFANKNRLLSWYAGGLNFQIEHHLYPSVCHVHYRHISKIVEETAIEYGYPYYTRESFFGTLWAHTMMLKKLGRSFLL